MKTAERISKRGFSQLGGFVNIRLYLKQSNQKGKHREIRHQSGRNPLPMRSN